MKNLGVVIAIVMVILIFFISLYSLGMTVSIYNKIVNAYQNVNEAVSNLGTEYQRRYALIGNLVAIVKETKGFEQYVMNFEKEIYIEVAKAKADATEMNLRIPDNIKNKIKNEQALGNILTNFLDKIVMMAQHYPQISDPNIKEHTETIKSLQQLRQELKDIEQISGSFVNQ